MLIRGLNFNKYAWWSETGEEKGNRRYFRKLLSGRRSRLSSYMIRIGLWPTAQRPQIFFMFTDDKLSCHPGWLRQQLFCNMRALVWRRISLIKRPVLVHLWHQFLSIMLYLFILKCCIAFQQWVLIISTKSRLPCCMCIGFLIRRARFESETYWISLAHLALAVCIHFFSFVGSEI